MQQPTTRERIEFVYRPAVWIRYAWRYRNDAGTHYAMRWFEEFAGGWYGFCICRETGAPWDQSLLWRHVSKNADPPEALDMFGRVDLAFAFAHAIWDEETRKEAEKRFWQEALAHDHVGCM